MQDFLKGIDNKQILIEVLQHSIDYLIENRDDQQTIRMCHKYGFQNPDDFVLTTRTIANFYRNCCTENNSCNESEINAVFVGLNPELHRLVPVVLAARRPEIIAYLMRRQNAFEHTLLESFDWDIRQIMGDSSFSKNNRQLTTVTLNCRNTNWKPHDLHFQLDKNQLCKFISALDLAIDGTTNKN